MGNDWIDSISRMDEAMQQYNDGLINDTELLYVLQYNLNEAIALHIHDLEKEVEVIEDKVCNLYDLINS
jgi:Mg2+ and Co2+ transporter CorA